MLAGLRRLFGSLTKLSAKDVTETVAARDALVIAPHPDDETLGCGATIMRKLAAGAAVTVLVVTDGSRSHTSAYLSPAALAALRAEEMAEAARRLGLRADALRWAGFVDGTLAAAEDRLVDVIAEVIKDVRPQEVYATCSDEPHPDHAALGRAARRACAAVGTVQLLEYPVWLWHAWPMTPGHRLRSTAAAIATVVRRRAVVVRTEHLRHAKMHALAAHGTQLGRPPQVPPAEPWDGLPPAVLRAAGGTTELFFPIALPGQDQARLLGRVNR
ncbi:PIG-L deacetylase family protein [Catellatospora paridis]|uniref:PIG-L deacetylase family protein n=1 Tax=Catellatospora paridis TaxID=1617086 RepID=UPI0012D426AB|nr:PIG-L family deacetylase [Catellatospora paridis]